MEYENSMLETEEERRRRKRSHLIVYLATCVSVMGLTIVASGVWAYLRKLSPDVRKADMGFVVAAQPLGTVVASPLMGLWANRAGSIRMPMIASMILFVIGNILYSVLYAFQDDSGRMVLLMAVIARFVVGLSCGNAAVIRSYIAGSTLLEERTVALTRIVMAQMFSTIAGALIAAMLIYFMKDREFGDRTYGLVLDQYTLTSWFVVILGLFVIVIMHPKFFQEAYNSKKEDNSSLLDKKSSIKPDYIGAVLLCITFCVSMSNTSLFETIGAQFISDQFAVSNSTAAYYLSMYFLIAGLGSVGVLFLVGKFACRFEERKLLIFGGLLPMAISLLMRYPIGNIPLPISNCTASSINISDTADNTYFANKNTYLLQKDISENEFSKYLEVPTSILQNNSSILIQNDPTRICSLGCNQQWCKTTNKITIPQLVISLVINMFSYAVSVSIVQSVLSKVLGSSPQGVWMGIFTGSAAFGRITGPIWISQIYSYGGYVPTFMTLGGFMSIVFILLLAMFRRIKPMESKVQININLDDKNQIIR